MTDAPILLFGFNYEFEGKRFAFDVPAHTQAEAVGRAAAIAKAELVGAFQSEEATPARDLRRFA